MHVSYEGMEHRVCKSGCVSLTRVLNIGFVSQNACVFYSGIEHRVCKPDRLCFMRVLNIGFSSQNACV
jgi:hypothetical protein